MIERRYLDSDNGYIYELEGGAEMGDTFAEVSAERAANPRGSGGFEAPQGLLVRTTEDAQGNRFARLGKDRDSGEGVDFGYRAVDTGEIVWKGTFEDVFAWAGVRVGVEPFDRHMAYWERLYAARRFARRLGALPSYTDLYDAYKRLREAVEAHYDSTDADLTTATLDLYAALESTPEAKERA